MRRCVSFGGGRQSTAALVLAARGELQADLFVFANVGDDSENPDTLAYVRDYSRPYAEAHGIELVQVQRKFKDGRDPSLLQYVRNQRFGSAIPLKQSRGHPVTRTCTYDWKIRVVAHYLNRQRGWVPPWQVLLGISWDESHRMSDLHTEIDGIPYEKVYPLCDMRISVTDCERIVAEAGLPPAPKSSCWFCPLHNLPAWAKLRLRRPDLFAASVELENVVLARQERNGHEPLYMSNRLKPLNVAVPEGAEQAGLFEDGDGECTSGYCWT